MHTLLERDGLRAETYASAEAFLAAFCPDTMDRIVIGRLSKTIADELGISIKTVEFHRANIMQKPGVRSAAELVQLTLVTRPTRAPARQHA